MKSKGSKVNHQYLLLFRFITYFGVPEVNINRKCTVLPVIRSQIHNGSAEAFLHDLAYTPAYEALSRGYETRLAAEGRVFLRVFRLMKLAHPGDLCSAFPLDDEMWIVHLGSDCQAQLALPERDALLQETSKILDDILSLQHLENRLFFE